ncbi:hypothetical protein JNW88_25495 [Micromonospora sp. ATA32]|nr:hypothetical protein [Micromonospora sp. ATA32]
MYAGGRRAGHRPRAPLRRCGRDVVPWPKWSTALPPSVLKSAFSATWPTMSG